MDPGGGKPDHDVAGRDARAVDQVGRGRRARRRCRRSRSPPRGRSRAARPSRRRGSRSPPPRQTSAAPSTSSATCSGVDRVGGDVVEEEERLGAGREHVVDPVRGEVGAAPAELPGAAPEHELRADRVGRGGEQPPLVDREEARERAEAALDRRRAGRLDRGAQAVDDRLGGRERDPGGGVGLLLRTPRATSSADRLTPQVEPCRGETVTHHRPRTSSPTSTASSTATIQRLAALRASRHLEAQLLGDAALGDAVGYSRVKQARHTRRRRQPRRPLHPLDREVVRARWRRSARASPRPSGARPRAALVGHVDPVEARRDDRRRGDAHVHLLGARRRTASATSWRIVLPRTIESSTITIALARRSRRAG